jgi:hypothetical protein
MIEAILDVDIFYDLLEGSELLSPGTHPELGRN